MAGQVILLPRGRYQPRPPAMAMRHSPTFLGAVLALVAMLGLLVASGWHSATVHDHNPIKVAVVDHHHDVTAEQGEHAPDKESGDVGPVHLLAHAAGHWVAFGGPTTAPVPTIVATRTWSILTASLLSTIDPSKLLRPPRG